MRSRSSLLGPLFLVLAMICVLILRHSSEGHVRLFDGPKRAAQATTPVQFEASRYKQQEQEGCYENAAARRRTRNQTSKCGRPGRKKSYSRNGTAKNSWRKHGLQSICRSDCDHQTPVPRLATRVFRRRASGRDPGNTMVDWSHDGQSESVARPDFSGQESQDSSQPRVLDAKKPSGRRLLHGHGHDESDHSPRRRKSRPNHDTHNLDRLQPESVIIPRATGLARYIYSLYPQLKRMPACPTAEAFARTVIERIHRGHRKHLRESLALWRSKFRQSGGRDERFRLRAWVEYVVFRASQRTGPHWPSDVELQTVFAELGAPRQRTDRLALGASSRHDGSDKISNQHGGKHEQRSSDHQYGGHAATFHPRLSKFVQNGYRNDQDHPLTSKTVGLKHSMSADDALLRHHVGLVRRAAIPAPGRGSARASCSRSQRSRDGMLRLVRYLTQQVIDSGGIGRLANLPAGCRTRTGFLQCVESRAPKYLCRSTAQIERKSSQWHRAFVLSGGHDQVARLNVYTAWICQRVSEGSLPSAMQMHYLHVSLNGTRPGHNRSSSELTHTSGHG